MNKCFRKRNRNECESWHYCRGWMHVTRNKHLTTMYLASLKNETKKSKICLISEPWSALCQPDFIFNGLNGKCCQVSCPVSIRTEWPLNALNLCYICPRYNTSRPSLPQVESTNNVSLPKVQSQGQGCGSVANGLLFAGQVYKNVCETTKCNDIICIGKPHFLDHHS